MLIGADGSAGRAAVKFDKDNAFQIELKRRVDEYFATTGKPRRDVPLMYIKTAIILLSFAATYTLLVFFTTSLWVGIPAAIFLGLVMSQIGFNIQHDGGHAAYSRHTWINKAMAWTLDIMGGSSYIWSYSHGVFHHTYVNITHEDTDVDLGFLARLTPHQKRYWFHRWQHLYVWPLYGLFVFKWHLFDDFRAIARGRYGEHKLPRPKGWDLVEFILGKAVFFTLAFVLPMMFHSVWAVLLFYAIVATTLGCLLSVVFQLAHAVEDAEFPMPIEGANAPTKNMENAWAVHQVETTVNFSRKSWMAAWLLGGLNFQIEHHLLPRICHVNFPKLSPIVEETCRKFDIKYNHHETFFAGVASHFRWLKEMGKKPQHAIQPAPARPSDVDLATLLMKQPLQQS